MAELVLAIIGVTANGATLAKNVREIAKSVKGARHDADLIATQLDLHQDVFLELLAVIRGDPGIYSTDAATTIEALVNTSQRIYVNATRVLAPLLPTAWQKTPDVSLIRRLRWHFKKDDVKVLLGQLESVKGSLQLMLSTLILAQGIQHDHNSFSATQELSARLRDELHGIRNTYAYQQACISRLQSLENTDPSSKVSRAGTLAHCPGVAAEIERLVSPHEHGSIKTAEDKSSTRSSTILSEKHRSVIGEQSEDIQILLDKWTVESTTSSGSCHYTANDQDETSCAEESESTSRSTSGDESPTDCDQPANPKIQSLDINQAQHDSKGTMDPESHAPYFQEHPSGIVTEENESPQPESPKGRHEHEIHVDTAAIIGDPSQNKVGESQAVEEPCLEQTLAPDLEPAQALTPACDGSARDIAAPALQQSIGLPIFMTYTQAWLQHLDPEDTDDVIAACTGLRGPFSDVTLLEPTFSPAPSDRSDMTSIHGEHDPKRADKLYHLGSNLMREKCFTAAIEMFQKAYRLRTTMEIDKVFHLMFKVGLCLAELRDLRTAEKVLRHLCRWPITPKITQGQMDEVKHILARTLARQYKWQQASSVYADLWAVRSISLHSSDARASTIDKTIRTGQEYSRVLVELGRGAEALPILDAIRPKAAEIRGVNDAKVVFNALLDSGKAYNQVGETEKAKSILNDLILRAKTSPQHIELVGASWHELAVAAYRDCRYHETKDLANLAIAAYTKRGQISLASIASSRYLALADRKLGDYDKAVTMIQKIQGQALMLATPDHDMARQLDFDLANLHLIKHEVEAAEKVLYKAYESIYACSTNKVVGEPQQAATSIVRLLEYLAPLMVLNARNTKNPTSQTERLSSAERVYQSLYQQHVVYYGQESAKSLQTGHDYGSLCLMLKQLPCAETVLTKVWDGRSKVFGADDRSTIQTGLQLGQAQFANNRKSQALATLESVFDLTKASASPSSLQTLQTAEILGYYYMDTKLPRELSRDPFDYVKAAFEARKELFGPNKQTCKAALEVALLAARKKDLSMTLDSFNYVFDNGTGRKDIIGTSMHAMVLSSGLASSALMFASDRKGGNRRVQDVIRWAANLHGERASMTDQLRVFHAFTLIAQNKLSRGIELFRTVYYRRIRIEGRKAVKAVSAVGGLLGLTLMLRALIRGQPVPEEVDEIDSDMQQNRSLPDLLTNLAMLIGIGAAEMRWKSVSRPLLIWAYRRQKRRFGRLSSKALMALAVLRALGAFHLASRGRNTSVQDDSARGLHELMNKVWGTCIAGVKLGVKFWGMGSTARVPLDLLGMIQRQIAKEKLWNQFTSYMGGTAGGVEAPQESSSTFRDMPLKFDYWEPPQMPPLDDDDDAVSRVWTITSEDEDEEDDDLAHGMSIDLNDILGFRAGHDVSSIAGSLMDLASSRDEDVERGESHINKLSSAWVYETTSDVNMEELRSNAQVFEREAGVANDD